MRDRLIELIENSFEEQHKKRGLLTAQHTADCLIDNDIIVPPCKVGDTVYVVGSFTKQIIKAKVMYFGWSEDGMWLATSTGVAISVNEQLGKTVFLTKEEAEKALRGEGE